MNVCPHCEQKIRRLNPHRMCRSKIALLNYIASQEDWVRITNVHRVSIGDAAVLAIRLQWFGLVEHGPRRSGLYRATPDGINFLKGTHAVPKVIWCRDGKVVDRDTTLLTVGSFKNVILDNAYWSAYPSMQRSA